jgi:hypothetical protein
MSSFKPQQKTHAAPVWFKGGCVGFERVPERFVFAGSAKLVREFVYRRSSPHVATEATGVAGGLGKRKRHLLRAKLPLIPSRVKDRYRARSKSAAISGESRTSSVDKSPALVHP